MRRLFRLSVVLAIVFSVSSIVTVKTAKADAAAAQAYVDEAKELIERRDFAGAASKLELAETELEGDNSAQKQSVTKAIADIKSQIATAQSAGDKARYSRDLDRIMRDLEGAIGNLVTWPGYVAELKELLAKPGVKAALGDELTKAQTKFQTFQKLHAKKAGEELTAGLTEGIKSFDETWNENKPIIAAGEQTENAIRYVNQAIDSLKRRMEGLPTDNPQVREAQSRIDAVTKEMDQLNAQAGAAAVVAHFDRAVELYSSEWSGWENETTAPTWEEFQTTVSQEMGRFKAPKSVEAWERLDSIIKDVKETEAYQAQANAPTVKATLAKLQTQRDTAFGNVVKNATAVVDGAEKGTVDQRASESYDRLLNDLTVSLRESSEGKALSERVNAISQKYKDATEGAKKAAEEKMQKLTAEADKAWPDMVSKFSAAEGFDPASAKSGSYYRIKDGANRMGWDYKPESGGFDFAMTTGGLAVAGNYAPSVKAAIEEVQKKIGQDIEDRGWDFVVQYEGRQGKLQQFREGSVQTKDGTEVGTYRETVPVDAPVVKIVALHIGPLAVAEGQGAVTETGSINTAYSGSSSTGGGGILARLFHLLIGVVAAMACLISAKFSPLISIPQVSKVQNTVGDFGLALIGLVCGVFGVLWFLSALLHFSLFAMLVTLAIIAAGLYAALDVLAKFNVVKPDLQAKIKPFGIPIGLACGVLVLVALFW